MKIQVGEYDVYAEGTIIGIHNEPIRFIIDNLTFELRFEDAEETVEPNLRATPFADNMGITLVFTNFNNLYGSGNRMPLHLGIIDNKDLFFNYRIYDLRGDEGAEKNIITGKTVHYTWLLKSKKEG